MKLLAKCTACNKRKLLIRKHTYKTRHAGLIKAQKETCGSCKKKVVQMLGDEAIK